LSRLRGKPLQTRSNVGLRHRIVIITPFRLWCHGPKHINWPCGVFYCMDINDPQQT
jgi:hypothetical protein